MWHESDVCADRIQSESHVAHSKEGQILNITTKQIVESLVAIAAFVPATVCTGYLAAWSLDLYGFRRRSLVGRFFWSLPLSLAITTILSTLVGRFLSLNAVAVLLAACAMVCVFLMVRESLHLRRAKQKWHIGWQPLGGTGLTLASLWTVLVVVMLVDFQSGQKLYSSLTIFDHSTRVSWIEGIIRTGVPPANPLYMYEHPAPLRYHYFWYVVCAAVVKMSRLPARAVLIGGCVWAGFEIGALAGLYIQSFLCAGERARKQFLRAAGLLMVTGLGVCVNLWNVLHNHPFPGDLEVWRRGQITSWFNSLLWAPHHVASMVCCMLGFLLAWMPEREDAPRTYVSILLIATAFASAFGLSIYVAFAFFLVMLTWILWRALSERSFRASLALAGGGAAAIVLLAPFLFELLHTPSGMSGGSAFSIAIRETIPPEGLLAEPLFLLISNAHPVVARNLANLLLLVPGYSVELGFFLPAFLIYVIPAWRGGTRLTAPQRSLVFISIAAVLLMSVLQSNVIDVNDFGWRAALLLQFPLLLMGSELLTQWSFAHGKRGERAEGHLKGNTTPKLVQVIASYALIFGATTTIYQALMLRFTLPLHEMQLAAARDPRAGALAHKTYIAEIGYGELYAVIPQDAVVQYNPWSPDPFWVNPDWLGVAHQSVIDSDQGSCGSEFGGDPSGCHALATTVDALYKDGTAEEARAACRRFGIQFLVADTYDQAWMQRQDWVWTLKPVVTDSDFRVVDCRE